MKRLAVITDMLASLSHDTQFANDYALEQQRQADEKARRWRERLSPLDARLKKILDEIPDHIQAEGIRLPPLVHQLAGRTRQHPSAGDVGKALRRLGFRRKRDWSNGDDGFPALWFPPQDQHKD